MTADPHVRTVHERPVRRVAALREAAQATSPSLADPAERVLGRITRVGLAFAAVAVVLQSGVGLVHGLVLDRHYVLLDPDGERNAFTWASAVATFAAAFAALLLASVRRAERVRLLALGALLAFFSLDDVMILHERLTRKLFVAELGLPLGVGARLFAVVYFPLLAAAAVLLIVVAWRAPALVRRLLVAGLGCLVLAVLAELVNAGLAGVDAITFRGTLDVLLATVEEGLELGGWILVATGLSALLCAWLVELGARARARA